MESLQPSCTAYIISRYQYITTILLLFSAQNERDCWSAVCHRTHDIVVYIPNKLCFCQLNHHPTVASYVNHLVPTLLLGGKASLHYKILFGFPIENGYHENVNYLVYCMHMAKCRQLSIMWVVKSIHDWMWDCATPAFRNLLCELPWNGSDSWQKLSHFAFLVTT